MKCWWEKKKATNFFKTKIQTPPLKKTRFLALYNSKFYTLTWSRYPCLCLKNEIKFYYFLQMKFNEHSESLLEGHPCSRNVSGSIYSVSLFAISTFLNAIYSCSADSLTAVDLVRGAKLVPVGFHWSCPCWLSSGFEGGKAGKGERTVPLVYK